jgi:hypothetical protein
MGAAAKPPLLHILGRFVRKLIVVRYEADAAAAVLALFSPFNLAIQVTECQIQRYGPHP